MSIQRRQQNLICLYLRYISVNILLLLLLLLFWLITLIEDYEDGKLCIRLYDKCDFPYLNSNIPQSLEYGIYVSQLIYYVRVC